MTSSFWAAMNMIKKNREFPFSNHLNLTKSTSQGHLKVRYISQRDDLLHIASLHNQKQVRKVSDL